MRLAHSKSTQVTRAARVLLAAVLVFMGALVWGGIAPAQGASRAWEALSLSGASNTTRSAELPSGWGRASNSRAMALVNGEGDRPSPPFIHSEALQGDGTAGPYILSRSGISKDSLTIYLNGVPVLPSEYLVDEAGGVVVFFHPVPAGSELGVLYRYTSAGRSRSALDLASTPLALIPLTRQVSLGFVYTESRADLNLPQVRGAMAGYDGGSFLLKGGLFAAAPTAKARASYMKERLAELVAVADGGSMESRFLPSRGSGGEAIPLFMRLRAGEMTTEAAYWAVDNSFLPPTDPAAAASQGLFEALGTSGAPKNDWNLLRGFQHFHNNLAVGSAGRLSLSQNYSLDKNQQTGHADFGLSWLNRAQVLSFGAEGDPLRASWSRGRSQTSWQDPAREGAEASTESLGVSTRLGRGTLSYQSKGWGVGSSFNGLPSGGSMPASAQSLVAALQGLGAPAGDWNQVRGFAHWEGSLGLQGVPGVSLSRGRAVDVNQQAGHGDFGLTWSNLGEALSFGSEGDAFRGSWTRRESRVSSQDPSRAPSEAQVHNLSLSQRLGKRMGLSFQEKWWTVDPAFNLPNWGSSPPSAQALVASFQGVGAPAGDWNQVRGLEHGEKTLALQVSPRLSLTRTYNLDRNRIAGHAQFGLKHETRRDALSLKSKDDAFQVVLGRSSGWLNWEEPGRSATRVRTEDAAVTQRFGRNGTLGFSQVIDTSTDAETLETQRVRKSTYSVDNLPLLGGIGLGVGGSFEATEGSNIPGTKKMSLRTAGPGLRLARGLSLQANYQEDKADGQGSNCSLGVSTSALALNSAVKIDSLQFTRSINAQDAETKQTNLNWSAQATANLTVSGQFQATEADGQGYGFSRTFNFTQKVSEKTSLTASYARQQQNEQRVTATKRLVLTRNDPRNRFTYSAIYDEMVDPQAQNVIRPVLETNGTLTNGRGASIGGKYIQRDQPDNSRLVTKELHVALPLDSCFSLQGDYVMNPHDPSKRDQIQSFTVNERWALTGKVGRRANLTLAYVTAENLQSPGETDTTDASYTFTPSQKESFSAGFRLAKTYSPGASSSHQGFVANYTRNLDENHFLRISATDEPDNVGFVNGMTRSTSETDTRYRIEFATAF